MRRAPAGVPFLFLAVLASWAPVRAQDARKPMVAVPPFTAHALDADALEGIGSALGSELINTGRFRVMERTQMETILKEQGFEQSGACDGSECAVQMGKLLSVDDMVLGSIAKVGSMYTLTARLVDVRTGEVLRSVTRNSKAQVESVLTEAIPQVARDLAGTDSRKTADAAPAFSSGSSSHWGWWLAGGAVLAGGATAAVLLLDGSSSPTSASNTSTAQIIQVTLP
jgi:hypothetical protein